MSNNTMFDNSADSSSQSPRWIVALTGASGTVYARRLVQALLENIPGIKLDVVVSEAAFRVMREEENISASVSSIKTDLVGFESPDITMHSNRDIGATIASGSYKVTGMIIVPCSMATLGAVANGIPQNLIHRAADVCIKEKRRLILVPRETPLSVIHLENLCRLARIGVDIVPAMPGFYHQPANIEELVDHFVMRILDQMGFDVPLSERWQPKKKVVQGNLRRV